MCAKAKQSFKTACAALILCSAGAGQSLAQSTGLADAPGSGGSAGGVSVGDGIGGVTDRAYVTAPPHYLYVVEKAPGSFLDCGAGRETRTTDSDGRDLAGLRCGVTLTETIVIPAAASSARITIHY